MATDRPRTLGDLRASGYKVESVKDEMRRNLIARLREGAPLFPDILGYEETVVPQIQNAILSRHDMLFLGLRGQAKTRMLRQLVHLLDDAAWRRFDAVIQFPLPGPDQRSAFMGRMLNGVRLSGTLAAQAARSPGGAMRHGGLQQRGSLSSATRPALDVES